MKCAQCQALKQYANLLCPLHDAIRRAHEVVIAHPGIMVGPQIHKPEYTVDGGPPWPQMLGSGSVSVSLSDLPVFVAKAWLNDDLVAAAKDLPLAAYDKFPWTPFDKTFLPSIGIAL